MCSNRLRGRCQVLQCHLDSGLDQVWEKFGVRETTSKRVDRSFDATVLSMDIREGTNLLVKASKLARWVASATDLMKVGKATPRQLAAWLGVVQWSMLVNRPLLSC